MIYITVKGNVKHQRDAPKGGRYVVAILRIERKYDNHASAAQDYDSPPSNCIVSGNPPLSLDKTMGPPPIFRDKFREYIDAPSDRQGSLGDEIIKEWNKEYELRASEYSRFIQTSSLFKDLHTPPFIDNNALMTVFRASRIPCTQTPPVILVEEANGIMQLAGINLIFR